MRHLGISALLALALAAPIASAATPAPHSERVQRRGRPAHGYLYLPSGKRPGANWEVIVRRGRPGPAVKRGEAIDGSAVEGNGRFSLKLMPGTYTVGGWRQRAGEIGRLCGLTSITVRPHKPIPVIHVHCRRGA